MTDVHVRSPLLNNIVMLTMLSWLPLSTIGKAFNFNIGGRISPVVLQAVKLLARATRNLTDLLSTTCKVQETTLRTQIWINQIHHINSTYYFVWMKSLCLVQFFDRQILDCQIMHDVWTRSILFFLFLNKFWEFLLLIHVHLLLALSVCLPWKMDWVACFPLSNLSQFLSTRTSVKKRIHL